MIKFPEIPASEFDKRAEVILAQMKQDDIDILVAFSNLLDPSAVRYYTNFSPVNESAAIIFTKNNDVTLCSGQASYDYALIKNKLKSAKIKVFPEVGEVSGFEYDFGGQMDFADYFEVIKRDVNAKRIAIGGKLTFPAVIYNKLQSVFDGAEFVNYDTQLYDLRVIKSFNEIDCIRKACEIVSGGFTQVVPQIKVGQTEREIQGMFEYEMAALGAESSVIAFSPMIATGKENSHISMCRNSMRQVSESEILNLSAGVCYEGYNGITCSPYVLGCVPGEIKDAVKCAYDALNIASSKMKDGIGAAEVLNTYTTYLTEKGYIDYCPYGSLHSTGMLECEAPTFSIKNNRIIKENMVVCIDAYFKGMDWGSFRIEDVYLITKNGAERLTTYNDAVIESIFS